MLIKLPLQSEYNRYTIIHKHFKKHTHLTHLPHIVYVITTPLIHDKKT